MSKGYSNPSENYENFIEIYLKNLKSSSASNQTVSNYAKILNLFKNFWLADAEKSGKTLKNPDFRVVEAWRDSMLAAGLKVSTVAQYMKCLKTAFDYVCDPFWGANRVYKSNPVSKMIIPNPRKQEKKPYDILIPNDKIKLLWVNQRAKGAYSKYWSRNYAVVILLLTTEIRLSELLALTPDDLDFENDELTVERGKGDKFRVVNFPKITQSAVKIYLADSIRPEQAENSEVLFGTSGNVTANSENCRENAEDVTAKTKNCRGYVWHKGTDRWLRDVVRRHVLSVTGIDNITPHDLRHVGARLDLNNGMSLEELQSKLGHESFTTTQIYSGKLTARRDRDEVRDVILARDRQAVLNEKIYKYNALPLYL